MHHQPVLERVDIRNPRVVPLEMQARRGDDAEQVLQRREGDRRMRRPREPRASARRTLALNLPVNAVRRSENRRAERLAPLRDQGRLVLGAGACGRQRGPGRDHAPRQCGGAAEEAAATAVRGCRHFGRRANPPRHGCLIPHLCLPAGHGTQFASSAPHRVACALIDQWFEANSISSSRSGARSSMRLAICTHTVRQTSAKVGSLTL